MSERIGVAVFGLGRAGKIHLSNIVVHPLVDLLWVVDPVVEVGQEIARNHHCQFSATGDEVWKDENIKGVFVASPTITHAAIIKKAIAAKKAIFAEKPLGESLAEVKEIHKLADEANVIIFTAFNRRFDDSYRHVKNAVTDGTVGTPRVVMSVARDNPAPWLEYLKTSHGIFHDCAVHDIDAVRWIVGENPTEVYTISHTYDAEIKSIDDTDTTLITMKFPSGCMSTTNICRTSPYGYDQRIEVYGDKGMAQAQPQPRNTGVSFTANGITGATLKHSFPQRYREAYYAELEHFVDLINGAKPLMTGEDNIVNYIISHFAEQSGRKGVAMKIDYSITDI